MSLLPFFQVRRRNDSFCYKELARFPQYLVSFSPIFFHPANIYIYNNIFHRNERPIRHTTLSGTYTNCEIALTLKARK